MEFQIGQRVRIIERIDIVEGKFGVIKGLHGDQPLFAVELEGDFGGHDCKGIVPSGKGWWVCYDEIEPASALSELTAADRRAGWTKLMSGEMLNAPVSLLESAEDAADLAAIREAIDRIGGRG